MLDHPNQLTKKFISNLFNREELDLDSFEFDYEFYSATECYKSRLFDETLLKVLNNYETHQIKN